MLAPVILLLVAALIPSANAKGDKSNVDVVTDATSVTVTPKKCYKKGVAFTWTICPKFYQETGKPEGLYLLILFTQRSEAAFPAFKRAEMTMTVDGNAHKTGDFDWTSEKIGRYALIPTNKDYLEQLLNAHGVSFSLQLSGTSTHSDIHLDGSGLQTLQAACGAILDYLREELSH